MVRERMRLSDVPDVIPTGVSIFHPQLRDLLQPAGEKGKVLFIHSMAIECADFNTMKPPTHFCTLDFAAVCLTTGLGLVAAGGEHSELDIRPLTPSVTASSDIALRAPPGHEHRPVSRWHLRTPTGGSINNSICIQPEVRKLPNSLRGIMLEQRPTQALAPSSEPVELSDRHREKRRKEDADEDTRGRAILAWKRDEPFGRLGEIESTTRDEKGTTVEADSPRAKDRDLFRSTAMRILISNNDRSVKAFRLRPPTRNRSGPPCLASSDPNYNEYAERIESGLPGLSRTQTIEFPTCINHSCFSPDGRHVVSVGDTPDVFLFSVHPTTGELHKVNTYTASADASFSTAWSPDSMQFAVASQDGFVSVWDVRSSSKIASLKTVQVGERDYAGAARVVKWSPKGDLFAFTEQKNYVHIVDAVTFKIVQQLRIPSHLSTLLGTAGLMENACEDPLVGQTGLTTADDALLAAALGANPSPTSTDELTLDTSNRNGGASLGGGDDWLESTSPARYANSVRPRGSMASLSQPWPNGRRYRDIGNSSVSRSSALDHVLLGDWANTYRSERGPTISGSGAVEPRTSTANTATGDASALRSSRYRSYAEAAGPRGGNLDSDWLLRRSRELLTSTSSASASASTTTTPVFSDEAVNSVESMLAHLSGDIRSTSPLLPSSSAQALRQRHGTVWPSRHARTSIGRVRGGRMGAEIDVDISGLTWDPDGDFLYVSTTDAIVRYSVIDTRSSLAQAGIR